MKLFKNKRSEKKSKKIATSTYEVIDIVLEDRRGILELTGSTIVGSSIQIQKVSRMVIMVAKDYYDITHDDIRDHMDQFDLMVWDIDDRNVFYVAGSISDFYTMCVSMASRHLCGPFTDYVINVLLEANYMYRDKYGSSMLTDRQVSYFGAVDVGEPVLNLREDYKKEMMSLIPPQYKILYDLKPIVINTYNPVKATIMSMAKFCFIGETVILAYVNPRQLATIELLVGDIKDEDDDLIATEVVK